MTGIWSKPIVATNDTVRIYVPAQRLRESKNIVLQGICTDLCVFVHSPVWGGANMSHMQYLW
jgi:hypothetical protein